MNGKEVERKRESKAEERSQIRKKDEKRERQEKGGGMKGEAKKEIEAKST